MSRSEQSGLWDDLDEMDHTDIEDLKQENKRLLATIEDELGRLRIERKEQVEIVKLLRSAIGKVEVADSGRRSLLREFHRKRKSAQKEKEERDSINKCIPPPTDILFEWLSITHSRLTTIDNDLTAVPMLKRELDAFSRFFELQSAIERKRVAESAHSRYASYVSEMRKITGKLDQYRADKRSVTEITDDLGIEDRNISRKEIRGISNRISDIDSRVDILIGERKSTRKELGRVEAYSRVSQGSRGPVKIADIKEIARSGGSLSTEEMGALLKMGGLSSLGKKSNDEATPPTVGKKRKKKGRRLGVSRSGSRKGSLATRKE